MIASEEQHGDLEAYSIYEATRSLVFFATPHRGLSTEDILSMINAEKHSERAALVKSIDNDSEVLQSQLQRFIDIALTSRFRIFSFYEQKKTKKLVEVRLLQTLNNAIHLSRQRIRQSRCWMVRYERWA